MCLALCIFGQCLYAFWERGSLSVSRGSHRCECHVTEVKKGKVSVQLSAEITMKEESVGKVSSNGVLRA